MTVVDDNVCACCFVLVINFAIATAFGVVSCVPYMVVIAIVNLINLPDLLVSSAILFKTVMVSAKIGLNLKFLSIIFYVPILALYIVFSIVISILVGFCVGFGMPFTIVYGSLLESSLTTTMFAFLWSAFLEFTESSQKALREWYHDLPHSYVNHIETNINERNEVLDISLIWFLVSFLYGLLAGTITLAINIFQYIKIPLIPIRVFQSSCVLCTDRECLYWCFLPCVIWQAIVNVFCLVFYIVGVPVVAFGYGLMTFVDFYNFGLTHAIRKCYNYIRTIDIGINIALRKRFSGEYEGENIKEDDMTCFPDWPQQIIEVSV